MSINFEKKRAGRNRTIMLEKKDLDRYGPKLVKLSGKARISDIKNKTIHQDLFQAARNLPDQFVDLLLVDPPYNLSKDYNGQSFKKMDNSNYQKWIDSWLSKILHTLKPTASIYVCCDWKSSAAVYQILSQYFIIRNRITWEREKGRGAETNWKNCSEDIWFATVSNKYFFNPSAVKLKRKIIAPYKDIHGKPKDWSVEDSGKYRLTYPSNLWTDITIPYWSMPENTDHPTQKPEKLIAKIILASSKEGDFVVDPFVGSGTTSVVAKKLNRNYCGIEIDKHFCCLAEKRIALAGDNKSIQGFENGVFWERNTLKEQHNTHRLAKKIKNQPSIFNDQKEKDGEK